MPKARKPAAEEPERQGQRQVLGKPRPHRDAGPLGRVDDGDIVGADRAGDADLLEPLQQAIIELPVRVDLALKNAVLDAAAFEVERFVL